MVAAAKQVFDEERESYGSRLQVLELQAQDLDQQLAEAKARATELVELRRLADQEARRRSEEEIESEGLRRQLALGRQALEASTQRLEEERKSHQNAADGLKLGHAQEIARLQEVIERSENHLLRQVDDARRQAAQLKSDHAAEVVSLTQRMHAEATEHRNRTEALMVELREAHVTLTRERIERAHLEEKNTFLAAEVTDVRRQRDEALAALAEEAAARVRGPHNYMPPLSRHP